jgi:hypothetical protein
MQVIESALNYRVGIAAAAITLVAAIGATAALAINAGGSQVSLRSVRALQNVTSDSAQAGVTSPHRPLARGVSAVGSTASPCLLMVQFHKRGAHYCLTAAVCRGVMHRLSDFRPSAAGDRSAAEIFYSLRRLCLT